MMSPLIDCVFLLLIFFLVTSIIKRYERQIPVSLADPTASLSVQVSQDAYRLGLSQSGQLFRETDERRNGITVFSPVPDFATMIQDLQSTRGRDAPVELVVERETPFQTVIDVLDRLQHAGLSSVRSRVRDGSL